MKKMIKISSVMTVIAMVFALFVTSVKADELSNNSSSGVGTSVTSNSSTGTDSTSAVLSSNNSTGNDAGTAPTSNNSSGAGAGAETLTSNNSTGASASPTPTPSSSPTPSPTVAPNNSSGAGSSGSVLSSNNSSGAGSTGGVISSNNGSGAGSNPTPTPVTPTPTPSTGGNGGGSTSNGGSHSTGSGSVTVMVYNLSIVKVDQNTYRVTWNSNIPTVSRVVYGNTSHNAIINNLNFGYDYSSNTETAASLVHSFVIKVSGNTYLRPISTVGSITYYGMEYGIENINRVVTKTVATSGSVEGSSLNVDVSSTETPATTTDVTLIVADQNQAAVGLSFTQKIAQFFMMIWHFLIGR